MNNKITFPRLATLLADKSGRSKRFSEDFLREFFTLIIERLEAGESIKVKGLGTFRLIRVEPRKSVDVSTGQPVNISAHSKIVFVPSKEMAEAVNAPFEAFSAIEIDDDADISLLFPDKDMEHPDFLSEDPDESYTTQETNDDSIFEPTQTTSYNAKPETFLEHENTNDMQEELKPDISMMLHESSGPLFNERTDEIPHTDNQESPSTVEHAEEAATDARTTADNDHNEQLSPIQSETFRQNAFSRPSESLESEEKEALDDAEPNNRSFFQRTWVKTITISLCAALLALIATFAVWYFFATHALKRDMQTSGKQETEGFVVGKREIAAEPIQTPAIEEDTVTATSDADELKMEDVPTAPSDAAVLDTISTTRYLTTMAKEHYGNYNLWPYIYEENKAFLGHPDRIRPGTPVVIPKLSKYGIDPTNKDDIEKAKAMGMEIYARYGKKI